MTPQTFTGITPERYKALSDKLQSTFGIAVSGNSGTASKSGFEFTWFYNEATSTLSITCTDHPWFVPDSVIKSKMQEMMEEA